MTRRPSAFRVAPPRPNQTARGGSMLRKLFLLAVVAALIGLGVFWFVTIPATVAASALALYTPNAANGREMFYAGGCAACHATPGQDDKTRLGEIGSASGRDKE